MNRSEHPSLQKGWLRWAGAEGKKGCQWVEDSGLAVVISERVAKCPALPTRLPET